MSINPEEMIRRVPVVVRASILIFAGCYRHTALWVFVKTTKEMIAARCSISRATLQGAFSSKRDLFTAVVEIAVRLDTTPSPRPLDTILLPSSDGHEPGLDRDAILWIR